MKTELRLPSSSSNLPTNPNRHQPAISLFTLDASCIEKLLLHCSAALETNDTTLAQQVMWVLHNVSSSSSSSINPNQRLASSFLSALLSRSSPSSNVLPRPISLTDLARYVDLTPSHRFGFSASNAAILSAVADKSHIHILDFGITHCMQWPTLIDSLSKRPQGPPSSLKLTVPSARPPVPPNLNVSITSVGHRLATFAASRGIPFEFTIAEKPLLPGCNDEETLVVNVNGWLRYLDSERKEGFLRTVRTMEPEIVTVTDEDVDADTESLTGRIMGCFNYFWMRFDAMEEMKGRMREEYEEEVGRKIENVVGYDEDERRIERMESRGKVRERGRKVGFVGVAFGEEVIREVTEVVGEHRSGWGMKVEEDMLVLTWKGHSALYTAAWVPDHRGGAAGGERVV